MLSKFVQPETDSNSEGTFVSQYTLRHPYTCTCNGVNTCILLDVQKAYDFVRCGLIQTCAFF